MEPFWHQLSQDFGSCRNDDYNLASTFRRQRRLVDVYNGDVYVGVIRLRTLRRFSLTALAILPASPVQIPSSSVVDNTKSSPGRICARTPGVEGIWKDQGHVVDDISSQQTGFARPESNPVLKLSLNAMQLPSNMAILTALQWMRSNASSRLDANILEFPPELDATDFWDLIDLYQAALSFELRPFPHRLKFRILDTISNAIPDAVAFRKLSQRLPLNDAAMLRLINTVENRRKQCIYTQSDLDAINAVVTENVNIESKVAEILGYRREQWYSRNKKQQINPNCQLSNVREIEDVRLSTRQLEGATAELSSIHCATGSPVETHHRRRRRRKSRGANYGHTLS